MTAEPFAFEVPDDAAPDLRAVALLGAGLAEVRCLLADLSEAHLALSQQVAEQQQLQQRDGAGSGAPTPLRWAELDRPGATALWLWLIDWVGWASRRFGLAADLPPCWPAHPPMVEELTALAAAWHAAYDPRAHPESPLRWLENFARARQRLRGWDVERCRNGTHVPPATDSAWPDGWRETALDTAESDLAGRSIPAAPPAAAATVEPDAAGGGGEPS
ncbi:hypothetical protein GCM10022255_085930 [Dactylosporangium darangshiense]|uniref:DUF4913 domain-containing protein n=1 Tax=Dactylosporangium darangshiense TaxID=579108 RepID=A0ABP8DMM7_9ACTN